MSNATLVVLIVAIAAVAAAIWFYFQKERTRKLKGRFGPEYERLVQENHGNAGRAESILENRQKRVSKYDIRPLSREECDRFAANWRRVQEGFVDDPRRSIAQADELVNQALRARGYPMSDFDRQAEDISVEHPQVVSDYRYAHEIALIDQRGQASTEQLRRAMQHYRNLFEHVLDAHVTGQPAPVHHEVTR